MELTYFIIGIFIFIIPIFIGILCPDKICHNEKKEYFVEIKLDETITKSNNTVDKTIFNEAKKILQSIGYTATEAKNMLNKCGPFDNVNDWVKCCMDNVKI